MAEEKPVINSAVESEEKSALEIFKELAETLKTFSLSRYPLEYIRELGQITDVKTLSDLLGHYGGAGYGRVFIKDYKEYFDFYTKYADKGFEVPGVSKFLGYFKEAESLYKNLKQAGNVLKALDGGADVYLSYLKMKDGDWAKGVLGAIKGFGKIASLIGKIAPHAEIAYGGAIFALAIIDLPEDLKVRGKNGAGKTLCDLSSGLFRSLSGVCKTSKALAPLAIPLSLFAGVFSMAGNVFNSGHPILGSIILIVGDTLIILLCIPIKAMLTSTLTAFTSLSVSTAATLSLSVVGAVAGLAILATIAVIIAEALASEPEYIKKQEGGFLATGQTFIAREAGPELIGTIRGRNAVVNNNQIVEAVSIGVYGAFNSAMYKKNSETTVRARVFLDGKQIAAA